MKNATLPWGKRQRHRNWLRSLLNLTFVLLLAFGVIGSAAAAPQADEVAPIADPYDLWSGAFLDFASPTPHGVDLKQPDGAAIRANLTPAETGGLLETADGHTILKDAEGWWTYATVDANGVLAPSTLRVGTDAPDGLAQKLGQTPSVWLDAEGNDTRTTVFEAVKEAQSPNASAFTTGDLAVKNYKYLVILAEFQDVKLQPGVTAETIKNQISGLGTSPTGTVTDLYYEMSYGQFKPEFDVIGPLTLPYEMAKYDYQLPGGRSVTGMITDLGPQLQALGIDWEQYDNDKVVYTSGGVQYRSADMVVVAHAGPGKEATGQDGQVWSHASTANYRTGFIGSDGKEIRIRGCNTVPEIGFNIGVVAHEMGHTIGEPDYYDTSYRSMGTGDWDLMAGGSWMGNTPAGSNPSVMNPFSRINQGWLQPEVVTATRLGIELKPRTVAGNVIKIPLGGTATSGSTNVQEDLYVEMVSNRVAGTIFDKAEYGTGLLIWHYDRGGSQTKPSSSPARYRMGLLEYDYRDGTQELPTNQNRGEPTDPWSDTSLGITPYSGPNTNRNTPLVAGGTKETGWHLMNISPVGDTMTFDVVQQADVQTKVGVDRPRLVSEPALVGAPVEISAKVYNLTAEPLADVSVAFWATMGAEQVKLGETVLATLASGSPTVATATWDAPVAGKFNIEAVVTAGDASTSAPGVVRVFARNAPVLLVDDDDGYTAEEAFEGALVSLGVPYVVVEKTASLALMQQYDLVIWSAGQAGRLEGQLEQDRDRGPEGAAQRGRQGVVLQPAACRRVGCQLARSCGCRFPQRLPGRDVPHVEPGGRRRDHGHRPVHRRDGLLRAARVPRPLDRGLPGPGRQPHRHEHDALLVGCRPLPGHGGHRRRGAQQLPRRLLRLQHGTGDRARGSHAADPAGAGPHGHRQCLFREDHLLRPDHRLRPPVRARPGDPVDAGCA